MFSLDMHNEIKKTMKKSVLDWSREYMQNNI